MILSLSHYKSLLCWQKPSSIYCHFFISLKWLVLRANLTSSDSVTTFQIFVRLISTLIIQYWPILILHYNKPTYLGQFTSLCYDMIVICNQILPEVLVSVGTCRKMWWICLIKTSFMWNRISMSYYKEYLKVSKEVQIHHFRNEKAKDLQKCKRMLLSQKVEYFRQY
jgi:hypothetical protein